MNNIAAGVIGGVTVAVIATSAMVFASRSKPGDDAQAQPVKQQVAATRTECTTEKIVTQKEWGTNAVVGTVLGGAAGGVLGHQIGGGHGKDVATAAGAVGGAYVGNKVAKDKFPDQEVSYRQRCREVPAG
ncbi:MAG: glycine zipper 2TM domain-containing protein [Solimonas sp.]